MKCFCEKYWLNWISQYGLLTIDTLTFFRFPNPKIVIKKWSYNSQSSISIKFIHCYFNINTFLKKLSFPILNFHIFHFYNPLTYIGITFIPPNFYSLQYPVIYSIPINFVTMYSRGVEIRNILSGFLIITQRCAESTENSTLLC